MKAIFGEDGRVKSTYNGNGVGGDDIPSDLVNVPTKDLFKQPDGSIINQPPVMPIEEVAAGRIASFEIETAKAINGGFTSDALGSDHTYDSEQHNIDWIQTAVTTAQDTLITCDDGSTKEPRNHTAAQSMEVLKDGAAALLAHKTKFRTLRDQVNAIVSDDVTYPTYNDKKTAIEAVVW